MLKGGIGGKRVYRCAPTATQTSNRKTRTQAQKKALQWAGGGRKQTRKKRKIPFNLASPPKKGRGIEAIIH